METHGTIAWCSQGKRLHTLGAFTCWLTCHGVDTERCDSFLLLINSKSCNSHSSNGYDQQEAHNRFNHPLVWPGYSRVSRTREEDSKPLLQYDWLIRGIPHCNGWVCSHLIYVYLLIMLILLHINFNLQSCTLVTSSCISRRPDGSLSGFRQLRTLFVRNSSAPMRPKWLLMLQMMLWSRMSKHQRYVLFISMHAMKYINILLPDEIEEHFWRTAGISGS